MTNHTHAQRLELLTEIETKVGKSIYERWHNQARNDLKLSDYAKREEDAQHAYVYGEIIRRFRMYQKVSTMGEVGR